MTLPAAMTWDMVTVLWRLSHDPHRCSPRPSQQVKGWHDPQRWGTRPPHTTQVCAPERCYTVASMEAGVNDMA